jgi:hypothetical protein
LGGKTIREARKTRFAVEDAKPSAVIDKSLFQEICDRDESDTREYLELICSKSGGRAVFTPNRTLGGRQRGIIQHSA